VIEIAVGIELRVDREKALALQVEAAGDVLLGLADIDARDEAEVGAKAGGTVDVFQVILPLAILGVEVGVEGLTIGAGAVEIFGAAGDGLGVEGPIAGKFEACIEGGDAVEAAGEIATGEEGADVGLLAEFALDAGDGDEGVSVAVEIVRGEGIAG